jgi:hypothetical protein
MKKANVPAVLALAALSLAASLYIHLLRQAPRLGFDDHAFRWPFLSILGCALILFVFLAILWQVYSRTAAALLRRKPGEILARDPWTWLPALLLALVPLASLHFIDAGDLTERVRLFGWAALAAVLVLKFLELARFSAAPGSTRPAWRTRLERLSLRKKLVLLFAASVLLANLGSLLLLREGNTFTGDEPHYLLIAHSLLSEGDLDLADNYARKDYLAYMPAGVDLDPHTVPGAKPGSRYSFHSPGVAFYLLPFYALGRHLGRDGLVLAVRFGMSLIGALFGLQLFLFALREWGRESLALGLWFLVSFSTPVYFYSIHVYPELFVGLFALTIFRIFRHRRPLPAGTLLGCGLLLSFFLWFHALKYLFLLAPFGLYCFWVLVRRQRNPRSLACFLAFPVAITALYFVLQKTLYGSFSLSTVSWRGSLSAGESLSYLKWLATDIPFRSRWETLAGYFLDQRDGLLLYAPIYFFGFLGVVEMARRRLRELLVLVFLSAPYVLVSAFLTQRAGYAPQARPLVSVIWVLAVPVGYFLAYNARPVFGRLFKGAAWAGLFFVGLLLRNPLYLYQETTQGTTERGGGIFYLLSNLHFRLPDGLPSYIKIEAGRWLPNAIWIGILAVFIAAYLIVRRRPARASARLPLPLQAGIASAALAVVFFGVAFYPRLVLYAPVRVVYPSRERLTFYSLSRVARMKEPGRFALLEDDRSYTFIFSSPAPLRELDLEVGSEAGDYRAGLVLFDKPVFAGETRREFKSVPIPSPPFYKLGRAYLYRITLELQRRSEVSTTRHPYLFALRPAFPAIRRP